MYYDFFASLAQNATSQIVDKFASNIFLLCDALLRYFQRNFTEISDPPFQKTQCRERVDEDPGFGQFQERTVEVTT